VDALDERLQRVPPAHVQTQSQRAHPELVAQLRGERRARVLVPAGHDDVGTGPGEPERHLPAQAAVPTGHQRDLATEADRGRITHRISRIWAAG
jgi:hypothetical protein